jgi:hypothetical protein
LWLAKLGQISHRQRIAFGQNKIKYDHVKTIGLDLA